jgi:hypothetical protein
MRGRKSALRVVLTPEEHDQLLKLLRSRSTPLGFARRCRAILEVTEGTRLVEVARLVGLTETNVRKWVQRFLHHRLAGLLDRPGRGRKPVLSPRGGDVPGQDRRRTA